MEIQYPVRALIVDVEGHAYGSHGWVMKTPAASQPHIGKIGTAEMMKDEDGCDYCRIELDDGNVLLGSECWWVPVEWSPVER